MDEAYAALPSRLAQQPAVQERGHTKKGDINFFV